MHPHLVNAMADVLGKSRRFAHFDYIYRRFCEGEGEGESDGESESKMADKFKLQI